MLAGRLEKVLTRDALFGGPIAGPSQPEDTWEDQYHGAAANADGHSRLQTQPVGLGRPPYLVIGFIGPVFHILKIAFWS